MDEILHIGSLQLLLEKFSDCLENFGFGLMSDECDGPRQQLFKLIMKYCTKIRYFDSDFHDDCAGLSSSVLQNLGQEYIMKKEKVKYLAIMFDDDLENELLYLKDEVNEFKLHNIIVRKFFDLYIDVYDFIDDFNN
ncbi:hypothetical protein RhiirA1_445910 [Rhizophagus irregularis]|uniref:Uncharacterized protein n=1 Tax=Rhizophagus irregularis TaxID=588596 RepID=A0A2N0R4B3_9GLOM|nr:hypothetical protein RhiirA1_445910 [Rhizophagus irregularis]